MADDKLVITNNPQDAMARVEHQKSALSRLFQLKPSTLELVSKSTHQEGATPGKFRDTATGQQWDEVRAVILFEPQEQRELYRKGEYSRDAKLCFSLDNYQPHQAAQDPKAMYCATCPFGDLNWVKYREAKKSGMRGEELSKMTPPCRKYWHLFLAERTTKMPYYFNVKGLSVTPFEQSMQNIARIMHGIVNNINLENRQIVEKNKELPADQQVALQAVPTSVSDVIWKVSFTMYSEQKDKGGQWNLGMKDFAVMKPEDYKEFGNILEQIQAARAAKRLQSQMDSEAEAASNTQTAADDAATEAPANDVAAKNAQIQI